MTKGTVVPIAIECPLTLCFKGDRTYLHGTDMYEALVTALRTEWPAAVGQLSFAFHRIARCRCRAVMTDRAEAAVRPENAIAQMTIKGDRNTPVVWVVEGTEPVDCRIPYDEDAIVANCEINGETIALSTTLEGFAPIEIAVAMTKRLHQAIQSDVPGRWMFTRIDLARPFAPSDRTAMRIIRRQALGTQLTRSEVFSGGDKLGNIFFSAVKQ